MALFSGRIARSYQILALIPTTALLVVLLSMVPLQRANYWAVDLGFYRAAALALRSGADPFLRESLWKYADGALIGDMTRYTYSPIFLLFLLPLTYLPLHVAIRAWLILNLCMLAASVLLLSKTLKWDLTARQFFVWILGIVVSLPTVHCLAFGQASIFVLFWLAATFYLYKRGRDVFAGACLALCFTKLQVLALVPIVLLVHRRRRLLGSWALTFTLPLVPFWWLLPSWFESLLWTTDANMANLEYLDQPCLNAAAKVLFTDGLPRALFTGITTLAALAVVIWIGASRGRNRESPEFNRVFALAISVSLLTAGYVRTHDLILLLVPIAILLNEARHTDATLWSKRISRASVAIACTLPYIWVLLSLIVSILRAPVLNIISILSVVTGLLALILGESRPQPQPSLDRGQCLPGPGNVHLLDR